MIVTELEVVRNVFGRYAGDVVSKDHDRNVFTIEEFLRGTLTLPKGGTTTKTIVPLAPHTDPVVFTVSCDATFALEVPSGGSRMTYDKFAAFGFPESAAHTTFAITQISAVTATPASYTIGFAG